MDFTQVAAYFNRDNLDHYDFTTGSWVLGSFPAQVKQSDGFISIWNRPTRKRMLYTAKGVSIPSSVIRVPSTQEIYMVGHSFGDSHRDTHYRTLTGLHQSAGTALHYRKTPAENAGIKGWAVEVLVKTTFADGELRSVNESQDNRLLNYGNYFLFLPSNTDVRRHDTVLFQGTTHYVLEVYHDSGMVCARSTVEPDARVNFVYQSMGSSSYNPNTQTAGVSYTSYNATGIIKPAEVKDIKSSEVTRNRITVRLLESFISFQPKIGDKVSYLGKVHTVDFVSRDAGLEEWSLEACQ